MSATGALIAVLIGAVTVLFFWARDNDRQIETLLRVNGQRLQDLARLPAHIEVLERAQGLKPGTSMHAAWKEGDE